MVKQLLQQEQPQYPLSNYITNPSMPLLQSNTAQSYMFFDQSSPSLNGQTNHPDSHVSSSSDSYSTTNSVLVDNLQEGIINTSNTCASINQSPQSLYQFLSFNGNSNFAQTLLHGGEFSSIFPNRQLSLNDSESERNSQQAISKLVDLIDKIIYLNSVNSTLKNVIRTDANNSSLHNSLIIKENSKRSPVSEISIPFKNDNHSDSSHSSNTSVASSKNQKISLPLPNQLGTNEKKRKRDCNYGKQSETLEEHTKIQKHNPIESSKVSFVHSQTHSSVAPVRSEKDLLLNQFCNYTVDSLKTKLTNTEKRGRGRPRKQPENTSASCSNTSASFYTKSAFHHVHFNK